MHEPENDFGTSSSAVAYPLTLIRGKFTRPQFQYNFQFLKTLYYPTNAQIYNS